MTPIEQVWNWNNFSGGEGDGFYYGPDGGYRAGQNIETRILENGVRVCNKLEPTGYTYTGTFKSVNPYGPYSFATLNGTTGQLYYNGAYVVTISDVSVNKNTIIGFRSLNRISDNTNYTYAFTATNNGVGQVHRLDSNFGGVSYSIATLERTLGGGRTSSSSNISILSLPEQILFTNGNSIFSIDRNETTTRKLYLPKDCEIIGITKFQDKFKVYYNKPKYNGGPLDGYIAYWDGKSVVFDDFTVFENTEIRFVKNDGDYDYVVLGDSYTSDLYKIGGLVKYPIRINIEGSTNNFRQLGTIGDIKDSILYLKGINKLGFDCLYSFGKYFNGTNDSLIPEVSGTNIEGLLRSSQWAVIYSGGVVYKKNNFFEGLPSTMGSIYSYALIGAEGLDTSKTIETIYIRYNMYHSDDQIKIYIKKDGGPYSSNSTGRTLIKNITGGAYFAKRGVKVNKSELIALNLGDFYQLEYKVEMIPGSTKSPILHKIKTRYLDNLKD